jgi:hypothetical protein
MPKMRTFQGGIDRHRGNIALKVAFKQNRAKQNRGHRNAVHIIDPDRSCPCADTRTITRAIRKNIANVSANAHHPPSSIGAVLRSFHVKQR